MKTRESLPTSTRGAQSCTVNEKYQEIPSKIAARACDRWVRRATGTREGGRCFVSNLSSSRSLSAYSRKGAESGNAACTQGVQRMRQRAEDGVGRREETRRGGRVGQEPLVVVSRRAQQTPVRVIRGGREGARTESDDCGGDSPSG
eukprot:762450-Hanusia_phi.AAC.1